MNQSSRAYPKLFKRVLTCFALVGGVRIGLGSHSKRFKKIKLLINLYFYYIILKICLSIYYSYQYDYKLFKLREYQDHKLSAINVTKLKELTREVTLARERTKQVGSPFVQLSYMSEFSGILLLISNIYAKILVPLYLKHCHSFNSDLILMMIGCPKGEQVIQAMIQRLCERISLSKPRRSRRGEFGAKDSFFRNQLSLQELTNGQLKPFNRDRDWLNWMYKCYFAILLILNTLFGLVSNLAVFGFLYFKWFRDYGLELDKLNDKLIFFEISLLLIATFYQNLNNYNLFLLTTIDQTRTVKRLIYEVKSLVARSEESRGLASTDRRLTCILFQYKLFVDQTKLVQPLQGAILFSTAQTVATSIILTNFTAPFMQHHVLVFNIFVCYCLLIVAAFVWLPTCHLQARCHHLYRALCSLLAHLIHTERQSWMSGRHERRHLTENLRRELKDPHRLIGQLTVRTLGFNFAYRDSLAYFFWCGMVLIIAYHHQHNRQRGSFNAFRFF